MNSEDIKFNETFKVAIENHNNKRFDSAEETYYKLLNLKPNNPQINFNLGTLLAQQKKFDLAKKYLLKACDLSPNDPKINTNLANLYFETGDINKSISYLDKVIKLKPNFAQAYLNKGIILNNIGKFSEAAGMFEKTIELEPNNSNFYNIIGSTYIELGDLKKAIINLRKSLNINSKNLNAINSLVKIFKTTQLSNISKKNIEELTKLFLFLYKKNLINHDDLFNNAKILLPVQDKNNNLENLLNQDLKLIENSLVNKIISSELFLLMLQKSIFRDAFFEKFIYKIRKEILFFIEKSQKNRLSNFLNFIISLAEQSFLNEYILFQSKEELSIVKKLENVIIKSKKIDELEISILACYYPLYKSFKIMEKLKNYKSNNNLFNDLIKMQIEEPLKEEEIKKSIKSIGKISDDISKKVKEQYEENPYPRWRYSTRIPTTNFLSLLNYDIRPNKFISGNKFNNPKILIAGCGTGKQLNNILARENSNVVAFDLSLSSLAYAKRKIDEVGSKKIEFIHGDILQLNKLNKKFDIIECMGVLHHMENPVKGLNILKNLLEPDGVLKLGLYSEIARKHIIELRQFTKDRNFKNNIIDIRNFRENIKNHENQILRKVLNSNDFYSTSNVRDLIFHVQEHRFTIPQISQILQDNNLEFLGFTFPEIKKKYSRSFLDDKKNISLENWHKFENENPDSFRAMYQFWVKRKKND